MQSNGPWVRLCELPQAAGYKASSDEEWRAFWYAACAPTPSTRTLRRYSRGEVEPQRGQIRSLVGKCFGLQEHNGLEGNWEMTHWPILNIRFSLAFEEYVGDLSVDDRIKEVDAWQRYVEFGSPRPPCGWQNQDRPPDADVIWKQQVIGVCVEIRPSETWNGACAEVPVPSDGSAPRYLPFIAIGPSSEIPTEPLGRARSWRSGAYYRLEQYGQVVEGMSAYVFVPYKVHEIRFGRGRSIERTERFK